jgi:hypothetical protein
MYPLYKDLRERLGEPLWHDAEGVPRYAPFEPSLLGIYDRWAVLFVPFAPIGVPETNSRWTQQTLTSSPAPRGGNHE